MNELNWIEFMIQNQQPTHTTTTTTIHSLPKQTPHTINFSTRSLQPQLTHSLIHSLQLASKSETLCLWFHGAQQLTLSLQPSSHSVDSLEKSPPKEKKNLFLCWLFPIFPRIGWLSFIGLCSSTPHSSSSSVSFLFSTLAPVTLIRFTGKFLRFHCPIFHGFSNF